MFIPHEVKEKVEKLEQEVKKLKAENLDLQHTETEPEKNSSPVAVILLGFLLIISIVINVYYFSFANTASPTDDQARLDSISFYLDGQIVKMSVLPVEGVVYRVQIGAYQEFNLNEYARNLDGMSQDSTSNFTKISLAGFSNIIDAQNFQQEVARMGLETAYIVAYVGDEPVGVLPLKEKNLTNDTLN